MLENWVWVQVLNLKLPNIFSIVPLGLLEFIKTWVLFLLVTIALNWLIADNITTAEMIIWLTIL